MGSNDIPKDLPKCELIRILAEKIRQRDDIDFNVLGRLDEFRKRVSGDVRQINELFPEYTPHDEQYHLKRLFYVAETVLGKDLIGAMNAGELLVLAVALYGHDWGMAVNEIEKNYIINKSIPNDVDSRNLWILPDEINRFKLFALNEQLLDEDNKFQEIPIQKWREYVRQTHAWRSGLRVRKFFEPIDGGVADAAARVCIAHWLDFEDLQDHETYPTNYSVMREEANLRALAIYLRLIDLLDLGDDRTPYVIWKFVAPRDPRSKMAWDRHRALRAITCPTYQEGRVIRVDGSTDSHEVYAALEDLRIWCNGQFRSCNDLLARMNDPRHKLDIYHIDWHVDTMGFKKTSIGFQFDRRRMFEILGKELYQGDSYVFLRELLQNSIDAIRMRREILRKYAKIEPANLGLIQVKVENTDDINSIITWTDDGIGMDEYIIENYLAIAGKSYYRSLDFEKMGLEMDPISRFGIGILSCFTVANSIEIETYKDPNLHPRSKPLKITIPDQSKRFRIEEVPEEFAKIGTTVRVFVNEKKGIGAKDSETDSMDVTKYLSIIAGFVEFPIIIDEYNKKTIILHPKENANEISRHFGECYRIHQLDLRYPWQEAIVPQDLSIARGLLQEKRYDLNLELGLTDCEGVITLLIPSDELLDFQDHRILSRSRKRENQDKQIRIEGIWCEGYYYRPDYQKLITRSRFISPHSVFINGILIHGATPPNWGYRKESFPIPRVVVNLLKKKAPILDVARTSFSENEYYWFKPILESYVKKICEFNLDRLLALDPFERLIQMGRITAFYRIEAKDLWKIFPHDYWPMAFLNSYGKIQAENYKDVAESRLFLFPKPLFQEELSDVLSREYFHKKIYRGFLTKWMGERVLVDSSVARYDISANLEGMLKISETPYMQSYHKACVRFICSPWGDNPPLAQPVLLKGKKPTNAVSEKHLLERAIEDPTSLNSYDLSLVNNGLDYYRMGSEYIELKINFIKFLKPFDRMFAYGQRIINIENPSGQELFRFVCKVKLLEMDNNISTESLGRLKESISRYFELDYGDHYSAVDDNYLIFAERNEIRDRLGQIWKAARECGFYRTWGIDGIMPNLEDFVPGTLIYSDDEYKKLKSFHKREINEFGKPI